MKTTPSNCRFENCHYNFIAPGENSQECIGCEGNKKESENDNVRTDAEGD